MDHLARNRPIITMNQIANAMRGKADIPDGAVAITLDDGYLINYTEAWPILQELNVPATIYLATGFIGTGRMMWTDHLEASILGASQPKIDLRIKDLSIVYDTSSEAERIDAFLKIKSMCKAAPNTLKDQIISGLDDTLGDSHHKEHPLYTFMDWDHVREMDASHLIEFGAHTVDHVSLAKVSPEEMCNQIDRSVSKVTSKLGHACHFFSYPEGQADDFDDRVISHLLNQGFDHAPTAIEGTNQFPGTNPFHLFRTMVGFEGRPYPFNSVSEKAS